MNIRDSFRCIDGLIHFYKRNDRKLIFRSKPIKQELLSIANSIDSKHGDISAFLVDVAESINAKRHPSVFDDIERHRKRLLKTKTLLNDYSQSQPGPFDEGVTVAEACKVSKKKHSAELLYTLAKNLKPLNTLEFGTNVGISSAYLALGMDKNTVLTTVDASGCRQAIAKDMHALLKIDNINYVQSNFSDYAATQKDAVEKIDLIFIDGHHQYQPTLDYLESMDRVSANNAVFVFDDIRWSNGMFKAWEKIREDMRFEYVVDFYSFGICFKGAPGTPPKISSNALKIF